MILDYHHNNDRLNELYLYRQRIPEMRILHPIKFILCDNL